MSDFWNRLRSFAGVALVAGTAAALAGAAYSSLRAISLEHQLNRKADQQMLRIGMMFWENERQQGRLRSQPLTEVAATMVALRTARAGRPVHGSMIRSLP